MRSIHRGVALGLALALAAASCGDDGGTTTESTTTTTTTTEAVDDSTTSTEVTTTTEAMVLTDSFRGVTSDTILVGYPTIDFDALNNDFGLDLTFASFAPAMERMVEDLNERGGINGRRVEILVRPFIPVGPTQADAICVELTEDVEVFAVLGGFAGPGTADVNECFTDLHSTILVGGSPNPEQLDRAKAPWIFNGMLRTRRAAGLVDLLVAEGRLAELGNLAIIASSANDEPVIAAARDAFDAAGTTTAFDATISTTGDEFLTRGEVDTMVERARREDVDTFLFIGDDAYANEQLVLSGDEFNLLWLDSGQVTGWQTDPPPGLEDARLILASGGGRAGRDDPDWRDCVRLTDEAYGVEIRPARELEQGETDYFTAMVNACLTLRLFEEVATAAGADLTNESFAAAVESFGSYTLPAAPFASLGPGKFDGLDTLRLTTWDFVEGEWTAISEPYNATP